MSKRFDVKDLGKRYIFQALVDLDFVFVYLDNVFIFSSFIKKHEEHLHTVFGTLKQFSLRLNVSKCEFGKTDLVFLGHIVSSKSSQPCSKKVDAILDFPLPVTIADLRRFLGLINFYRRWLPQAASLQALLFDYTADSKKNDQRVIDWSREAKQAFQTTKSHLAEATLLVYPSSDAEARLVTDASDVAVGATLEQLFEGDWKPLAFFSRKLSQAQNKTTVRTIFTTVIEYLPGLSNVVADALSRVEVIHLPLELELPKLAKEQQQDSKLSELLKSLAHSLNLKSIKLGHSHTSLYCALISKIIRPFIRKSLRRKIFDLTHSASHLGTKVTDLLIKQKHVKNEPLQFIAPDDRFHHVHMVLVGPLNTSQGYSYILTMIDRFSRWVEGIPLKDMSTGSSSVSGILGCSLWSTQIFDHQSGIAIPVQLFQAYLFFLGFERKRTLAYHPAANGMIERWHRSFKAAVMCHNNADWINFLPLVLLGLRRAVRSDTSASPSDFLYGTNLRVPREFFLPSDFTADTQIFIENYREHIKKLGPVPITRRYKLRAFFLKDSHPLSFQSQHVLSLMTWLLQCLLTALREFKILLLLSISLKPICYNPDGQPTRPSNAFKHPFVQQQLM
ncbi:uncharacterized protein LOC106641578 [Copidosoma floridanum]|uniref:uncharacterized protein LOC106641578 n=1 Tax=Copidosoma floridanum TaxID=29053 RepID=UPI0006C98B66|nr:uncharacterized protein LOC106641578 [Copidosoma floridanum]